MEVIIDYDNKVLSLGVRDFWAKIELEKVIDRTIKFFNDSVRVKFALLPEDINNPVIVLKLENGTNISLTSVVKKGNPYRMLDGEPVVLGERAKKDLHSSARLTILNLEAIGSMASVSEARGWKNCMKHFKLEGNV